MTATSITHKPQPRVAISIGILAWNEAETITPTLESLFQQSVFKKLAEQNLACEIICAANGCHDDTVGVTERFFERQRQTHPYKDNIICRVAEIKEAGRFNAWNVFIHDESAKEAEVLYMMDADILFNQPDTLWNMYMALMNNPQASIATSKAIKDIVFKQKKNWRDELSLAMTGMNQTSTELMTGQLNALRTSVIRNIYLPKGIGAVEDGFMKALVCTDFLTRPYAPGRIIQAPDASHIFEPYTEVGPVFKNQKRQMIGQTAVHVLVDKYLPKWPVEKRMRLAETLREMDRQDPGWIKKLVAEHMKGVRFFWQLFPGLVSFRWARWKRFRGVKKLLYLPPTIAAFIVTMISGWMAYRVLRKGAVDYWPSRKGPKFAKPPVSPSVDRTPSIAAKVA